VFRRKATKETGLSPFTTKRALRLRRRARNVEGSRVGLGCRVAGPDRTWSRLKGKGMRKRSYLGGAIYKVRSRKAALSYIHGQEKGIQGKR